ncbi:energy transducer TonB [Thalassobellus suaedae]|uniref:Energy transducer TonB n=1 Tax=Thalassobellus suaedae TaxID=3074124 RepID=A0ABY9Y7W6_9FLAO|nr:energy transducer TonB [Flavobacteriaceae bacterium HL-DH10]
MENYIENIELINSYLNKALSESEILIFENRLKTDSDFNSLFDEHTLFLEGLKRQKLKTDIVKAKQIYVRNKWFKALGILISVLAIAVVFYAIISNKPEEPIQSKNLNDNSIVVDTIPIKKAIETSIKINEPIILKDSVSPKKEVVKVVALKPINNVETSFKKTPQKLKINTQKDTVLVCKEGTKLIIKANSFVDAKGDIINGNINLNVTEYYKLSDMLLANLSTISNGKQLETGGMLFIEAKKGEVDLKLKENTSIEILFPTKNKKKDMQLFSGEWKNGLINWNLEDNAITESVEFKEFEEDIDVPFAVVQVPPIYPGCENLDKASLRKNCTSDAISKFVQRKFNTDIASIIGLTGRQRINVIFKIDKNGDVANIRVRANHPDLVEEAQRVISLLPKMQPGKQRGEAVSVPYSLPIIFQVDENTTNNNIPRVNARLSNILTDSIITKKLETKIASKDFSVSDVNNYILRSSFLGWINCDRFRSNRSRIKYKFKIKNSEGAIINMVFKEINSVLPSSKYGEVYDFKEVPNDEDVILVAIKKNKGKLYLDFLETKTQENPNLEFNFKEVTIQELKNKLKALNKLF